jgi:membrane protease YdiL (CAAX protease family)
MLKQLIQNYLNTLRRHPFALFLILATFAVVIYYTWSEGKLLHGIGYLGAVVVGGIITDIAVILRPKISIGFPIKKPVKQEVVVIFICTFLGVAFLLVRFFIGWETLNGVVKLMLLPLILFTFPVVLAAIYLFRYRYKPRELGVNLNCWYLPIILHLLWAAVTLSVAPESSHWKEAYKEYGLLNLLFTGIVTAALSEEFVRMLIQTRTGKLARNFATGFIVATTIWAFMHIPIYFRDHADPNLMEGCLGAITIMPIGFFWGYLTYRTKSMIPAILMHGFNLWGLQNV